ncbi:MAG: hypothetical protein ACTSXL_04465 [Alphaproteobacteria bacterium]
MLKNLKFFLIKNKYILTFILTSIIFLAIKIPFISFKFSDENTYFLMAKQITQDQIPYKDFFLANPPLQVYLLAFFMLFINKNYLLLKLIPLVFSILTAFFVFLIGEKLWNKKHGLFASTLFLFSFIIGVTHLQN